MYVILLLKFAFVIFMLLLFFTQLIGKMNEWNIKYYSNLMFFIIFLYYLQVKYINF